MKNSFILMYEHKEIFDSLTNEQIGILLRAIYQYEIEKTEPELNGILKIAFIPIRQSLDRNTAAYEKICERNSDNGTKGGRPKKKTQGNPKKPKKPTGLSGFSEKPKKADSVSDSDNDSDNEIPKDLKELPDCGFEDFYSYYPRKVGKGQAEKAYNTATKEVSHEAIMDGLQRYLEHHEDLIKSGQFVPEFKYPATWLNGKCWKDELDKPTARGKPNKPTFFEMLDNIVGDESEAIDI